MKKTIALSLILFIATLVYGMKTYSADLESLSARHFKKLCEITDFDFKNLSFRIHEYDNLGEFRAASGGQFYIKGFTSSRGIFIQSRNLLREEFTGTLIHELLHALIKSQYPVPLWFEEGLVGIVTEEFNNVSGIPVMNDIENFDTNRSDNNWELTSYCLGCIKRVKEIIGIE